MIPGLARLRPLWSRVRGRVGGSSEFDLLARTFFERFFDTEITAGSADLRLSFFWLIAFLATPGIFMPILMSMDWGFIALYHGPEALRVASRGSKVFYLGFAMLASGALSVVVWNSLLLDRRDSLVLGTLPVRGATIVRAKIVALAVYIAILTIAMHALASIAFGACLAVHNSTGFAFAGMIAHFVASTGASAFVLLFVTAAQGVLFASLGPRRFDALSPSLQILLVAALLLGITTLPSLDFSASPGGLSLRLLLTPPLWFLGLYESVLTTSDPTLIGLNRVAVGALATVTAATLISYPLAYRRLVSSVVETGGVGARRRGMRRAAAWVVTCLSRASVTRASVQFFVASLARSSRHRFIVAASIGLSVAAGIPVLFRWWPELATPSDAPPIALLALPLQTMVFLLVGLRIAAALPADLGAGWAIACIGPPTPPLRAGTSRTMFAAGVVPITAVMAPIYWRAWGAPVALTHVIVCLALGAALTEALLWGFDALPCSQPWRSEHANLRIWWPAYLFGFLLITGGLPALEQGAFSSPLASAALVAGLAAIGLTLRVTHRRRRVEPPEDLDEPGAVQLLNLNG